MLPLALLAAGLGGLGAGAIFGRDKLFPDPAKKAMGYLDQIPETLRPYFEPYSKMGQELMPGLRSEYEGLVKDPSALMKRIGATYQESPGFQFMKNQGLSGIQNAAAAGGMLGSEQHQQQAGELATNLANKDYYDYMDRALKQYGLGLSGEQGLEEQGYGAGKEYATDLADLLGQKGKLSYESQVSRNQMLGDMLKQLLSLGGTVGGAMAGKG